MSLPHAFSPCLPCAHPEGASPHRTTGGRRALVHRPIEPLEGGVHLTPDVAYLNHFQGLLRANFTLCSQEVLPGKEPDWWTEDGYLAELVGMMMKKAPPKKRQRMPF
ncbi:unnamed protein product [Closterium sp. NIES-54]